MDLLTLSDPLCEPVSTCRGSYSDALSHFHAAVDADPNNYMSYYKRATVYMALSRPRYSSYLCLVNSYSCFCNPICDPQASPCRS